MRALVVIVLLVPGAARAGWHTEAALGAAQIDGALADRFETRPFHTRWEAGYRRGAFELDATWMATALRAPEISFYGVEAFGVSIAALAPLAPDVELYLRAGAHVTWSGDMNDAMDEGVTGHGLDYGGGVRWTVSRGARMNIDLLADAGVQRDTLGGQALRIETLFVGVGFGAR